MKDLDAFLGEEMTCVFCGKVEVSDPAVESQWRAVSLADRDLIYACPDHFPEDGASRKEFADAYEKFIKKAVEVYDEIVRQN